jgi:Protein of unknown function (DUF3761)
MQKYFYLILLLILGLSFCNTNDRSNYESFSISNNENNSSEIITNVAIPNSNVQNEITTSHDANPSIDPEKDGSNNEHYINCNGEVIHDPAFYDDIPPGASALCNDGSYSFSRHHTGTCSRGMVA